MPGSLVEMFERSLRKAKRARMMAQFQLDTELFLNATIDEVSVLFSDPSVLSDFVEWAKRKGLTHFNSVDDSCYSERFEPHSYRVRLDFLSFPDLPWRIEAMCILSGDAPLHRIHLEKYGNGCPVHASFKCKDQQHYEDVKQYLLSPASGVNLVPMVEYRNAYGLYAYFGGPETDRFYVKPRVNLRDQ